MKDLPVGASFAFAEPSMVPKAMFGDITDIIMCGTKTKFTRYYNKVTNLYSQELPHGKVSPNMTGYNAEKESEDIDVLYFGTTL